MHKETLSEDRKKYLRKILIKKVSVVLTQVGILFLSISSIIFIISSKFWCLRL